jgi:hypothetical protein
MKFVRGTWTQSSANVASVGILLLNAANEHQKPLKLGVVAIALPEIDKLADHLEITDLIVAVAVDPVE